MSVLCRKHWAVGVTLAGTIIVAACSTPAASPAASVAAPASDSSVVNPTPSATVSIGTLTGKILFTRAGGDFGDETIFTADADGRNETRVTPPGSSCCPRWAPDGSHILTSALTPDGRITVGILDPDGSHERTLPIADATLNLGPGAWSPDGSRIAFEGWDDTSTGRNGIYTALSTDGSDLFRVTDSGQDHDVPMNISPDGSQIFFQRAESLYVVGADGTGEHQITPAGTPVDSIGTAGGRLSPDGNLILFVSSGVIWSIRADGSDRTSVFQDFQKRLPITPTWSPDGRFILFGLDPPFSSPQLGSAPPNGLYLITAEGSELTPLVVTADWKREPDWVAAH